MEMHAYAGIDLTCLASLILFHRADVETEGSFDGAGGGSVLNIAVSALGLFLRL